jgi:phage terminase large subunit-like protein
MPGFGPAPDNPKHKLGRAPGFCFHEWSLDRGDDSDDLELVALANPASWIDEDALRARKASPSMQDWQWKRFSCGLWVAGEDSALSATDWAACAAPGARIPDGAGGVVVGGDLGYRVDCSAFIAAWRETPESPIILGRPAILAPPGDGGSIAVEDMVEACLSFAERYPACSYCFDPKAGGEQLLQRLEGELSGEHELIEFPQMTGKLCGASMRFAELVGAGMIRHPDDPDFTAHVLAASARFIGERWRFARPRGQRKPIDALTAAMTAVDYLASRPAPWRSRYSEPGSGLVVA